MDDVVHIKDPEMQKKRVTQFTDHSEMFAGNWEGSERFLQLKAVDDASRGGAAPILGGGDGHVCPSSVNGSRSAANAAYMPKGSNG